MRIIPALAALALLSVPADLRRGAPEVRRRLRARSQGREEGLGLKTLVVYEPAQFDPPQKDARGWSEGRLHVRGLVFTGGTLSCRREWDLVTPPDLKVGLSHGQITENSAREGASKNLAEQLQRLRLE